MLDQIRTRTVIQADAVAMIYMALNKKDKAFEWLNKSYEDRTAGSTALKIDPIYDSLRSDPRFNDLLRRMNLQP